jgi:predicted methyltransferase
MEKPAQVLLQILAGGRQSLWEVLRQWPYTIVELHRQLQRLRRRGWVQPIGRGWQEIAATAQAPPQAPAGPSACQTCEGKGLHIPDEWLSRFRSLTAGRPLPVAAYDQGFMRAQDTVARVSFMHRLGDVAGRAILLLGDDDLVSVAVALTGLAKRIVVLDIDARLGAFLRALNAREGFRIEFRHVDLRHPLPADLTRQFDVFVGDPVETLPGLELFLSRGVCGLRGRYAAGYFGLTTLEASLDKWYRVQGLLQAMRLVVTDILRDFSLYPEGENRWQHFYATYEMTRRFRLGGVRPDCDWYRSSLLRVEAVDVPSPTLHGPVPLSAEQLYRDAETVATPADRSAEPRAPGSATADAALWPASPRRAGRRGEAADAQCSTMYRCSSMPR